MTPDELNAAIILAIIFLSATGWAIARVLRVVRMALAYRKGLQYDWPRAIRAALRRV